MSLLPDGIVRGYIVPGMPQILRTPELNPGWASLRSAMEEARVQIEASGAELLLLYSTRWPSILGHQIQAHPRPRWVHVDQEWHELGSIPYELRMDAEFGAAYEGAARARGLHARTVAYEGFPIDTATVVALRLLDPDNRLAASVVSCNLYADRAETLVLGKAAADAIRSTGRRTVAVAVTTLTSRIHTRPVPPEADHVSSKKDDEWNHKLLEILAEGRLEDVSQLARQFSAQAHADQKLKAIWWLAAVMGQHNRYTGRVLAYAPVEGTGSAVVELVPSEKAAASQEFDEEDVDAFQGERNVLALGSAPPASLGANFQPLRSAHPHSPTPSPAAAPSPPDPLSRKRIEGEESHDRVKAPVPGAPPLPARAREAHRRSRGLGVRAPGAGAPGPVGLGASRERDGGIVTDRAPAPVGAYPHARRVGDLLYLSGVGPRQPGTNEIPGGPIRDAAGQPQPYDVEAQTRAVVQNVVSILEASGSCLENVVDVTVFLVDMARDFAVYNRVYAELLGAVGATRTTLEVRALPTPIAVEFKVIALAGRAEDRARSAGASTPA